LASAHPGYIQLLRSLPASQGWAATPPVAASCRMIRRWSSVARLCAELRLTEAARRHLRPGRCCRWRADAGVGLQVIAGTAVGNGARCRFSLAVLVAGSVAISARLNRRAVDGRVASRQPLAVSSPLPVAVVTLAAGRAGAQASRAVGVGAALAGSLPVVALNEPAAWRPPGAVKTSLPAGPVALVG
jgi:hypothetical protein